MSETDQQTKDAVAAYKQAFQQGGGASTETDEQLGQKLRGKSKAQAEQQGRQDAQQRRQGGGETAPKPPTGGTGETAPKPPTGGTGTTPTGGEPGSSEGSSKPPA
jgi:hypothetical protein